MGIVYGTYCDIGDVKKVNQDNVLAVTDGKSEGLFIVADGCGGLKHGERVSKYIVQKYAQLWESRIQTLKFKDMCRILKTELFEINNEVREYTMATDEKVGSTIALLYIKGKKYMALNVGDSRIYSVGFKSLKQISMDQSVVAEMVRKGELTTKEAQNHRQRNVLTMCIGMFENMVVAEKIGSIPFGGKFLLCSDGLYNFLDDKIMVKIINYGDVPQKKVRKFRDHIIEGKARDNISAIIVESRKNLLRVVLLIICTASVLGLAAYKFIL